MVYQIIQAKTAEELTSLVTNLIAEGWQPLGGVSSGTVSELVKTKGTPPTNINVVTHILYQAMTKS